MSREAARMPRANGGRTVSTIRLIVCLLAPAIAGCAGGREFVRPNTSELILGETTEQDVRQRMGDPRRQGTLVKNGETLTTLAYSYALAYPYVDDVKMRAMGFYFLRGVLAGYEFTSSLWSASPAARCRRPRRGCLAIWRPITSARRLRRSTGV